MGLFSFLSGGGSLKAALKKGALVVDIRSPYEYDNGFMPGSLNIPIERLAVSLDRIKYYKSPVVIVGKHTSSIKSAIAYLKKNGISDVHNGGSWKNVFKIVERME